jgi:hypothetical protein
MRAPFLLGLALAAGCGGGGGGGAIDARPGGGADARPADAAAGGADAAPAVDASPDAAPTAPDAPPAPDAGMALFRGTLAPIVLFGESASQGHRLRVTGTAEPTATMSGEGGTLRLGPP